MDEAKRIGIMGGTFNPPHLGHLLLAEWALEEIPLDQVLFLPTGTSYMKSHDQIPDKNLRLEMVRLAIKGREDGFSLSDMEVRRNKNTYTCETLQELNSLHPENHYYFIVGADCLFSIESWRHPDEIFHSCTLVAASRNHMSQETLEQKKAELTVRYQADILLMTFPSIDISSTEIRNRCAEGKSIRYLVPDNVCQFIEEHHLYR